MSELKTAMLILARACGAQAYLDGKSTKDNPCGSANNILYYEWLEGWHEARAIDNGDV